MVSIIDYGMGNVSSVQKALNKLDVSSIVTADPGEIEKSRYIILPGVGSFNQAMKNIRERNLIDILNIEVMEKKKPILGICLGMQLFADMGYEDEEQRGLGFISGSVVKIESDVFPVPHMGWNEITIKNDYYFDDRDKDLNFYFVHSYHFKTEREIDIAATVEYGSTLTAAVQKGNIFGTQFHPEKSQEEGLQLLKSFLSKC